MKNILPKNSNGSICKIDECGKKAIARLMCNQHYSMWRRHGDPLAGAYRMPFKKALKRANLASDIRVHDLRHTAASLYINYGMSPAMVAELLGHSNPAITLTVYSHLYKGELARSMGDVEKKIAQELIRVNTATIQSETA